MFHKLPFDGWVHSGRVFAHRLLGRGFKYSQMPLDFDTFTIRLELLTITENVFRQKQRTLTRFKFGSKYTR